MSLVLINFYELFNQHLLINVLATLGYIYENEKIEDDVAEAQEILPVSFAKLCILDIFKEFLNHLILDEILSNHFLLRKFEQNLDDFALIVELIEYLEDLQHYCIVNLTNQFVILDNVFNCEKSLIFARVVEQASIFIIHVRFHGIESNNKVTLKIFRIIM